MTAPLRLWRCIQRPEYFFRPSQIWRRLRRASFSASEVRLAWGLPIEVDFFSQPGSDMWNLGVHDRVVPETICRLLDPGERAFDIGAHSGQNASLMALIAGPLGRVTAFEPADRHCRRLRRSIERWRAYDLAPIELVAKGVSSRSGTGILHDTQDSGGLTLEAAPTPGTQFLAGQPGTEVELTILDGFLPEGETAALIKIDVEGHELAVLEGAGRIIGGRRVRDVLFEDFGRQPSPVTLRLESAGYTVFYVYAGWSRPVLVPLAESKEWRRRAKSEPNFLATTAPERAEARFRERGWKCLRMRALLKSDQLLRS
jgi:FkbM family methyltransferase